MIDSRSNSQEVAVRKHYIRGSLIAEALGIDKKTVHTRAQREGWPLQQSGNRWEYQPPEDIAALIVPVAPPICNGESVTADAEPRITFTDLPPESRGRLTALRREEAVQQVQALAGLGRGHALRQTVAVMVVKYSDFNISTRSLMRWEQDYQALGIDGLVEQKLGKVGRKGTSVPANIQNLGKALVIEHGSVARAARELMCHPDLPAGMRERLHEGHASKSYVTPSIRAAIRPAPLTTALAQGPRHARLSDRFTPGNYDDVRAGDVYVSDDMTDNGYCWMEWPNANGWKIGQAQILPTLDVGSLKWLTLRVIMRENGQYNADDAAGTFGDAFDQFGLPRQGVVLEGGIWQSNKVIGTKTGLTNEERIGGFASLGLKVFRSYDPRSKVIETCFNQLQYAMDAFCGYSGRDQRSELPEKLKSQLALLSVKNPLHHPRQFLPHISQLATHIEESMAKLNDERGDGIILRGQSPNEKWMSEAHGLNAIPDSAKWLYRSAMNISDVTKNGVRVKVGSGKKQLVHYYDNPELLVPLQGRKVVIYWNDSLPEADACLMVGEKGSRKFVGVAKYVQPLNRFSATKAELTTEAKRKQAAMHYSRTELRSIQPDLKRNVVPVPVDAAARNMGEQIAQAADRAQAELKTRTSIRRTVARTEVSEQDIADVMNSQPRRPNEAATEADISDLLSSNQ